MLIRTGHRNAITPARVYFTPIHAIRIKPTSYFVAYLVTLFMTIILLVHKYTCKMSVVFTHSLKWKTAAYYVTPITKQPFNLNAQCHEDYFPSFCVQSYAQSDLTRRAHEDK